MMQGFADRIKDAASGDRRARATLYLNGLEKTPVPVGFSGAVRQEQEEVNFCGSTHMVDTLPFLEGDVLVPPGVQVKRSGVFGRPMRMEIEGHAIDILIDGLSLVDSRATIKSCSAPVPLADSPSTEMVSESNARLNREAQATKPETYMDRPPML